MFESLQDRLGSILNGLTGRGALSEADVSAALREVRRALLEADVGTGPGIGQLRRIALELPVDVVMTS